MAALEPELIEPIASPAPTNTHDRDIVKDELVIKLMTAAHLPTCKHA
jgi:hypothetical protein